MDLKNKKCCKNNLLINIKSKFILKQIIGNINEIKFLKIINYNKIIQKQLNIDINTYKKNFQIEIEIIPNIYGERNKFITFPENKEKYFHIYFNNNKEEIKRDSFTVDDKVNKIKILIDSDIKSFKKLFSYGIGIKKLNVIRFNRKDIVDMSYMFYMCNSLEELNLKKINTDNVTNMEGMFSFCNKLRELNIEYFNTKNVTNMRKMFEECYRLEKLNIKYLNTKNVTDVSKMFYQCSSLKELNLNRFDIKFNTQMDGLLCNCSNFLKIKIKKLNKNIRSNAFS
jgi:surface protein